MAGLIRDDIDFAAYEESTEFKAKVRPAGVFADELDAEFTPPKVGQRRIVMGSTKLRTALEFRDGEVTVWAGYNGHRKSMFAGQVALDLCHAGERVLMASFEMAPADTLARMARQCFAVARPASASLQQFSRWTDGRLWIFDHMGRIDPARCLAVVRYFAEELKGGHVFIDSMMMVCASEESLDEQKQFMTDVVRLGAETGLHMHLIAHCRKPQDETKPPTKYDVRGSSAISDQADNVITVWANKVKAAKLDATPTDYTIGDLPDALVSVEKQRGGKFEGKLKLWFDETCFRFSDDRTSAIEPYVLSSAA